MTDFTENPISMLPSWDDVPELATTGRVLGGEGGPANAQAYALTARTEYLLQHIVQCIPMACSDETTDLTTGLKLTFRMPYAMSLTDVRASFTSFNLLAPSIVDIHCNGVSIFTLGNLLTIDTSEYSSVTGTPYVLNDNYLPDNSTIEVYLTDIGAGTPKGLKVYLIGVGWQGNAS